MDAEKNLPPVCDDRPEQDAYELAHIYDGLQKQYQGAKDGDLVIPRQPLGGENNPEVSAQQLRIPAAEPTVILIPDSGGVTHAYLLTQVSDPRGQNGEAKVTALIQLDQFLFDGKHPIDLQPTLENPATADAVVFAGQQRFGSEVILIDTSASEPITPNNEKGLINSDIINPATTLGFKLEQPKVDGITQPVVRIDNPKKETIRIASLLGPVARPQDTFRLLGSPFDSDEVSLDQVQRAGVRAQSLVEQWLKPGAMQRAGLKLPDPSAKDRRIFLPVISPLLCKDQPVPVAGKK